MKKVVQTFSDRMPDRYKCLESIDQVYKQVHIEAIDRGFFTSRGAFICKGLYL